VRQGLPDPEASGIEHIIVVTMENRSYDHFLGWLPHTDGKQEDLTFFDESGTPTSRRAWRPTSKAVPSRPGSLLRRRSHRVQQRRVRRLAAGRDNDEFSIGFYKKNDLQFLGSATRDWTTCDRYFCSIMAETWPNKIYQYAAQTDRSTTSSCCATLPTIWDRLATAGVSARYYFNDVPFVALWGLKYLPISRLYAEFLADAAAGTLPAVSFIDPRFIDEASGTSADDHPHSRHPQGREVHGGDLPSRDHEPQLVAHRCSSSRSTNGVGSSTTCRRRWDRSRPRTSWLATTVGSVSGSRA
jgi:phospholipase C